MIKGDTKSLDHGSFGDSQHFIVIQVPVVGVPRLIPVPTYMSPFKESSAKSDIHSPKLTWKPIQPPFKGTVVFIGPSWGFHVSFREGRIFCSFPAGSSALEPQQEQMPERLPICMLLAPSWVGAREARLQRGNGKEKGNCYIGVALHYNRVLRQLSIEAPVSQDGMDLCAFMRGELEEALQKGSLQSLVCQLRKTAGKARQTEQIRMNKISKRNDTNVEQRLCSHIMWSL